MDNFQQKLVLALLAYLSERGVSPQRICTLSGMDYTALTQQSVLPIEANDLNNLWKNAVQLTNDENIGLHFGEAMQLAALGIVGQVVLTSSTVGEALTNAGALVHIIADMFQIKIHHTETSFTLFLTTDAEKAKKHPQTAQQMAEFLMVFIVHELDGLLIERVEPLSIGLPYTPIKAYEYSRILRSVIHKTQDDFYIEFDNKMLNQPVISANYELHSFLLQKVQILQKKGEQEGVFQTKIYNYLLTNAYMYSQSLETVAANFNMSARHLQRKLQEENTSFLEIADLVRKNLALNYLNSTDHAIKDIAYMLGYNEQSAFLRAFKRWTGQTPSAYRNSHFDTLIK
jgi:AraC-like DNA-binding protein